MVDVSNAKVFLIAFLKFHITFLKYLLLSIEHALVKIIKSHAHIRPPRRFIPTVSYMAPGPYYSIPYYKTEPYSSGGIYRSFIPHDAYY
jgi:hypothetical protein